MKRHPALLVVFLVSCATLVAAQGHALRPVQVVNLPEIQPVTGEELRASQELLALLLLRMTGTVPEGVATLATEECEVVGLTDFHQTVSGRIGEHGCSIGAYAGLCSIAAARHRAVCGQTCAEFLVRGAHRSCRGNDRPVIEPFSEARHCSVDSEPVPWISCTVTRWCNCDP